MDQNQIMLHLAEERGCVCEICNIGIWIKQLKEQPVPDYLVLYHKDGNKDNNNFQNLSLRCKYCSIKNNISRNAFKEPTKKPGEPRGHVWFNNGRISKLVREEEVVLFEKMEWERGRIRTYREPPSNKGKIMITNGIRNKNVWPEDPIPDGWWKGKTTRGYLIQSSDYRRARPDSYLRDRRKSRPQ